MSFKNKLRFLFKDHFAILDELTKKLDDGNSTDEDLSEWEACMSEILRNERVKDKVWKAQTQKYSVAFRK